MNISEHRVKLHGKTKYMVKVHEKNKYVIKEHEKLVSMGLRSVIYVAM